MHCFDTKQLVVNIKKRHHFKRYIINNMDHMRISGTEPSSVKVKVQILTVNELWSRFNYFVSVTAGGPESPRGHM